MKKIYVLVLMLTLNFGSFAQAPEPVETNELTVVDVAVGLQFAPLWKWLGYIFGGDGLRDKYNQVS